MTWRAARLAVLGRDPELEQIDDAFSAGRGVLLVGEAGIGKTTILDAIADAEEGPAHRITASSSSSELPLGAFLGIGDAEWSAATTSGIAAGIRARLLADGTTLLAVDDAHQLDPASAGLILELSRSGLRIAAAARSSEPVPAAIEALVRDRRADRIVVGDMAAHHVASLAEAALGAPVGHGLALALAERSGGHPLYLREIVEHLRVTGVIAVRNGEWRLEGPMPPLDRVPELIRNRIAGLDPASRAVLATIAVADGLDLRFVHRIHDAAAIESAEVSGVVRVVGDRLMPGHPLHRDAAIRLLPDIARRAVLGHLIEAHKGSTGRMDSARVTMWRRAAGLAPSAEELLSAAEIVFDSAPELCRELVDAATEVAGPADVFHLALLQMNLGRGDRAEDLLAQLGEDGLPAEAARSRTALRAFGLGMMQDRPAEALRVIEEGTREHGTDQDIEAARIAAEWRLHGTSTGMESAALRLRDDASAPLSARASAGSTLNGIRVQQVARAPRESGQRRLRELLRDASGTLTEGVTSMILTESLGASVYEGDLAWARTKMPALFSEALVRGTIDRAAQFGWTLGWTHLLRGRPRTAARWVTEWSHRRGPWSSIIGGLMVPRRVRVLVASGRITEARDQLPAFGRHVPDFDVEHHLAQASIMAVDGDPAASDRAVVAARAGAAVGAELPAVEAAFVAALLGHPDAIGILEVLLRHPETELQRLQLAVGDALRDGDGVGVLAAAAALSRLGHRWWAIESLHACARLPLSVGQELRLTGLLRDVEARCEPLTTLVPAPIRGIGAELTGREAAVARLAAAGLTDREIATRLTVSVRTVESHLAHAYSKLGIHTRSELPELFHA